jgi:hypothetical protein
MARAWPDGLRAPPGLPRVERIMTRGERQDLRDGALEVLGEAFDILVAPGAVQRICPLGLGLVGMDFRPVVHGYVSFLLKCPSSRLRRPVGR